MIPHTYQMVFGYFDFAAIYREIVASAPHGATLVELGVLAGKSSCFLAVEAHNADRGLRTVHVDSFPIIPPTHDVWSKGHALRDDGTLYATAWANLVATQADRWELWRMDQEVAAGKIADSSAWAVWLDTDHAYGSSLRTLRAWWPKVKPGGWFGGHDYGHAWFPGLKTAVDQWARAERVEVEVRGMSWIVRKHA